MTPNRLIALGIVLGFLGAWVLAVLHILPLS